MNYPCAVRVTAPIMQAHDPMTRRRDQKQGTWRGYWDHVMDRHVALGLALATLLAVFDLLDHTVGPVDTPASGLIVIAPLVTAARADAVQTGFVAIYASLLTVVVAPTHTEASSVDLAIVAIVAVSGSLLAVFVAASRDRAQRAERESARELRHLQGMVDVALEHVSLEELMPELLDRIAEALEADAAMFLLVQNDGRRLVLRVGTGALDEGDLLSVAVGEGFAGRVVAERAPYAVEDLREAPLTGRIDELLRERGMTSLVGVPLFEGEELTGVLQIATTERRRFSSADMRLLQAAADRAAVAIRRARLYEREHHIAATLQRTLVPARLPEVPGVELAVRYHAAGDGIDVGGDFYDVFCVERRWWLVLGDVAGKGPEAAAITALTRYSMRDGAARTDSPGDVLAALNTVMRREREPEDVCSAVCIALEPNDTAGTIARVATAGHPPPLVLRSDGLVEPVDGRGPLVGARAEPEFPEESVVLAAGDLMLLYTDGATEAATSNGRLRVSGLRRMLERCQGSKAEQVVDAIERSLDQEELGETGDDRVLLALRAIGAPESAPTKDGEA